MGDETASGTIDAMLATAGRWDAVPAPDVVAALHNLLQVYALFTDEGRADELAALFTADASWDGTDLGYGVAEGPAAIAATVLAHFDPQRPMVHLPGPPLLVAGSGDEAQGVSWCLATRSAGQGGGPLIFFHYHDDFRRDDAGAWRFARRVLRLRFRNG